MHSILFIFRCGGKLPLNTMRSNPSWLPVKEDASFPSEDFLLGLAFAHCMVKPMPVIFPLQYLFTVSLHFFGRPFVPLFH